MLGSLGLLAGLVLAAVFAAAGIAKLADRHGTRAAVREFGAPQHLVGLLAIALPLAELAVALLLIPAPTRAAGALGALALLGLFSAAIAVSLARGRAPDCHCFGQLHSSPASWRTLARNGILAGLGGLTLTAGLAGETPSAVAWLGQLAGAEIATLVLSTAVAVVALAGTLAFLSLMRSYGGALVRLETIEQRLAEAGMALDDDEMDVDGLPVGSHAPALALPTLGGGTFAFDAPESTETVVVFWNPACGFCRSMHERLRVWERDATARSRRLVIVSAGDEIASAAEGFSSTVVLDPELAASEAFRVGGTPMAVRLDAAGRIASPLAAGAEAVIALAHGSGEEPGRIHIQEGAAI